MAKEKWGEKRTCYTCESAFYDMNKSEIICPSCGTAWSASAKPPADMVAKEAPKRKKKKSVVDELEMQDFNSFQPHTVDDLMEDLLDEEFINDEIPDVSEVMESETFYQD